MEGEGTLPIVLGGYAALWECALADLRDEAGIREASTPVVLQADIGQRVNEEITLSGLSTRSERICLRPKRQAR